MTLTTPTIERRRSARRRACLGGSLSLAVFLPDVECRLRDLSLTGVRIVVDEGATLPDLVDLTVPCRNQTRRARLVWRSGTQAGLRFVETPDGDGRETKDAAERVAFAGVPPARLH